MADKNILEIQGLSKSFKGLKAVNDVSFTVREGSITGMIGSNGAGKTTTFNMISGVLVPTAGKITYKGQDITGKPSYSYTGMGIARTFQIMKPLRHMSVLDNVISGAMYGRKQFKTPKAAKEYAEEILQFTGLYERRNWLPGDMGTPFKKRLEVARALATDPDLLLLDEVMAGCNPQEKLELVDTCRKVRDAGVTILIIEHDIKTIMSLCDKIYILHRGEKLVEGTPEQVANDKRAISAYLGEDFDNAEN